MFSDFYSDDRATFCAPVFMFDLEDRFFVLLPVALSCIIPSLHQTGRLSPGWQLARESTVGALCLWGTTLYLMVVWIYWVYRKLQRQNKGGTLAGKRTRYLEMHLRVPINIIRLPVLAWPDLSTGGVGRRDSSSVLTYLEPYLLLLTSATAWHEP